MSQVCYIKKYMKKIYVAKSAIHGIGVMAGEHIKKGELIHYIKGIVYHKTNRSLKDALANPCWIGLGPNKWLDPIEPCRLINHSCSPNAGIKGTVSLFALRDIALNEEIHMDYSTTEADVRWFMPCSCGTQKCRGNVTSIQLIPLEVFQSYLPYIPRGFQGIYRKHNGL